jgi:hypothetical protein
MSMQIQNIVENDNTHVLTKYIKRWQNGKSCPHCHILYEKSNVTIGVMVAKKINGIPTIAWAKVNQTDGDNFDKKIGFSIINARFRKHNKNRIVPLSIKKDVELFINRAKRYFKTDIVEVV